MVVVHVWYAVVGVVEWCWMTMGGGGWLWIVPQTWIQSTLGFLVRISHLGQSFWHLNLSLTLKKCKYCKCFKNFIKWNFCAQSKSQHNLIFSVNFLFPIYIFIVSRDQKHRVQFLCKPEMGKLFLDRVFISLIYFSFNLVEVYDVSCSFIGFCYVDSSTTTERVYNRG